MHVVSWVTSRLVVSCVSCTKVNLLLHAQGTWPETREVMTRMRPRCAGAVEG
jgi:hypothetical protein